MPPPRIEQRRSILGSVTSTHLIALSFAVQLGLLVYGNHVDSNPEKYGGLRYTDVDWRVVSDGAKLIFGQGGAGGAGDGSSKRAEGWFINDTGLPVGDPYARATFRYTPLLPLLLSPTIIHPLLGKLTLVLISLLVTPLLLVAEAPFWPTHILWTLNPFVLNINTRGSPESIIVVLVVMLLLCLRNANRALHPDEKVAWETFGAVTLGLAVSWKIYPVIYVPAIWALLAGRYGWLGGEVWWFGAVTFGTLFIVNWSLWSIWGQPFLDHTFLYHLTRLDHRHNFSPYFYPIYQSLFPTKSTASESIWGLGLSLDTYPLLGKVLRHPLTSFLPQTTVVAFAGFRLPKVIGIEGTMFFQTCLFVVFNKVVTSQYFIWFLPLLPHLIPHLNLTSTRASVLVGTWIAAQAIWLSQGYRLEFLGQSVHLEVWWAGLALFGVSCWVLGELIDAFGKGSERAKAT